MDTAMNQESRRLVTEHSRVLNIVAAAMGFGTIVYPIVAWLFLHSGHGALLPGAPALLVPILLAAALTTLLGAEGIFRTLLAGAPGDAADARVLRYRQAVTIAFALREAAAIIGFVLTLLTGNMAWSVGTTAVVLLAMAAGWPRRSTVKALADSTGPPPIV